MRWCRVGAIAECTAVAEEAKSLFAIHVVSPSLDMQLKDDEKPVRTHRKWAQVMCCVIVGRVLNCAGG